jgi:hypothetical protein
MIIAFKKRRFLSILVIFSFSINLLASSGAFAEGVRFLKNAERARLLGNEKEELEYLQKAFQKFMEGKAYKEKLMLIHTGRLIRKDNEIEPIAVELVKQNRNRYISMIAELDEDVLDMDKKRALKEYLLNLENRIPFIDNVKLRNLIIYPYRGDISRLEFILHTDAVLSLDIDGESPSIGRFEKGPNSINFNWQDSYVNKNRLNLILNSRNDYCEYKKGTRVNLDISFPDDLYYSSGYFAIMGKEFKNEQKQIISGRYFSNMVLPSILLTGGTIGLGVWASTWSNEPNYDEYGNKLSSNRQFGYIITAIVGLAALAFLITTFSKNTRNRYKKIVPDHSNIKYNRRLRDEINRKKSEIEVKMQLEEH